MEVRREVTVLVAVLGLITWTVAGHAEPRVATLSTEEITTQSALLRAAYEVGTQGEEHIVNGAFTEADEEGAPPAHWEGPVLLHNETEPDAADLELRGDLDPPYGDLSAHLRYRSAVAEGWVAIAWEQELDEPIQDPEELTLSYFIRHQHSAGTGHISHHGGFVELELAADGASYHLRFFHPRHGELPEDHEGIAYVDAGELSYRAWSQFAHDVPDVVAEAFPDLDAYRITVVRIGVLMHKTSAEVSGFNWLFDAISLSVGAAGASVGFAYRIEGAPSWAETGWTTVTGSGVHEASLRELETGTRYEYRALLRTSEASFAGETRGFTTLNDDDRC